MSLKSNLHELKLKYQGTKWAPLFNGFHTFLYTPDETTHSGGHIRAVDDLKRTMNTVILALVPCLIFGIFNAGYQHHAAQNGFESGMNFFNGAFWNMDNFIVGAWKVIPLVIVSYVVGLAAEFVFAIIKGHEIEEGYLVTGMLVPLIVPVDLPLWMLSLAVIFGVVIGKEVFGGTGMNILNPALTIRAFLFFAYPTWMTGDKVWVHGAVARDNAVAAAKAAGESTTMDVWSGETMLGAMAQNSTLTQFSTQDMLFGFIPGSVGETSALLIGLMALFLIFSKIGSWRIIVSAIVGALVMGYLFNLIAPSMSDTKFYALMNLEFWKHLIIGGLAFGIVYMATDPVTAAQTNLGKIYYGFLVGFMSVMIRVFNPAFPEGVMLAILLMNVFAPYIDHLVVQGNVKRRMKRLKAKTA
jgi:Na+-transporting NADH:ubiquinone oxidoreductase subunit B